MVEQLTANIEADTGVYLKDTASSEGDDGADLTVEAFFQGYSVVATTTGVEAESKGQTGSTGSSDEPFTGAAYGGDGGTGGSGGSVVINLEYSTGLQSSGTGIAAYSIGGDGGAGGYGESLSGLYNAHGGTGGTGGAGGFVEVLLKQSQAITVESSADGIYGIYVSSQGGDGGEGGNASTVYPDTYAGDGGSGGDGGEAIIKATAGTSTIDTTGNASHGVFAQTLGGAGGDGHDASSSLGGSYGGDGGVGGEGGKATVTLHADVTTSGDQSQGILLQSYGGSGGQGGSASSITFSGEGGAVLGGGPGGDVSVTFKKTIRTEGDEANGILAQSIGGFSGDAGSTGGFVVYGAGTESGGDGGSVEVTIDSGSTITTSGETSAAVDAQSIGGGGGKGSADSGSISGLGGDGNAGGDGGEVTVEVTSSTLETGGANSNALSAMSVGGGGGSGGSGSAVVTQGGSGGTGGDGGGVSVTLDDAVLSTAGQHSEGLLAASIGGGGGTAQSTYGIVSRGGSGGDGGYSGTVIVTTSGDSTSIATTGADSDAILLQSVGGGGGNGANALSVSAEFTDSYGGSGSDGGNGGAVTYNDEGAAAISTEGDRSGGVVAQSVGGGGGNGGNDLSVTVGVAVSASLGMSGGGGLGADAGDVSVTTGGTITTQGVHAAGILAQSIGGGGGSSGNSVAVSADLGFVSLAMATGGTGGEAGSSGKATVTSTGEITTTGDESDALVAQSIGGGGGAAGSVYSGSGLSALTVSMALGQDGGKGGAGDTVYVTTSGDISTAGSNALGILAQSIGGGGGKTSTTGTFDAMSSVTIATSVGGSAGEGGDGVDVTVNTDNGITTTGDNAVGLAAQSIGGNGGNGSIAITGTGGSAASVSVAIGASGGASGSAGEVTVAAGGSIATGGELAHGILAQSTAGTGGNGGTVISADALEAAEVSVSLAGTGGSGVSADTVSVNNTAGVTTEGSQSVAILAQSIGGGGGSGGSVYGGSLSMGSVAVSVGGGGGDGGTGGEVEVTNNGVLQTQGVYAYGIAAQSLGGAGGSGGSIMDIAVTAGELSGAVEVSVGGSGGDGGDADDVTIDNENTISTIDFASHAMIGQSIGGAGGTGGSVISAEVTASSSAGLDVTVEIGGTGGSGGTAGDVYVSNSGQVSTSGDLANGILAESIGGDGGVGGSSYSIVAETAQASKMSFQVSVGGDGGTGSEAGDVTVDNTGSVVTEGGGSNGIMAQSIGGNGGSAGAAINAFANFSSTSTDAFSSKVEVQVGGSGGTGQDSGTVTVTNAGTITTADDVARGIYAQTIGGGGGDGGAAAGYSIGKTVSSGDGTNSSLKFTVTVGGSGGAAGDGDEVKVTNTGEINTSGIASYGIFAQSVGGGGGNAGDGSVSLSGWAADVSEIETYVSDAWDAYKTLSNYSAIFSSYSVNIGGAGGSSGNGGDIEVDNYNAIMTIGDSATAIFAQSVGGGGGSGGAGNQNWGVSFAVGGSGSGGGDGGDVTVSQLGAIETQGDSAMGIFAQSVGGGGGAGGNIGLSYSTTLTALAFGTGTVGSDGGDGGDGGDVFVETAGTITTSGDFGHGIWTQSVGGGGGATGSYDEDGNATGLGVGSAGDDGNGGEVEITIGGAIALSGEFSVGITAQSVSGGSSGYTSGDVTIDVGADVTSTGTYGRAILAQSQADEANNQGTIAITVESGATVSTSEDGYDTISLLDGNANTITNYGTIEKEEGSSVNNYVVINSGGSLTIDNEGTLSGSVALDDDYVQQLDNSSKGTVELGLEFDLGTYDNGTQSTFYNSGTVSAGAVGTVQTSAVTVPLFSSDGTLWVDINLGLASDDGSADLIELTGDAELDGILHPDLIATNLLTSSEGGTVTVLTADSVSEDLTVASSSTVAYSLSLSGGTDLQLTYSIDYAGVGDTAVDGSSADFADYLDEVVPAVRSGYADGSDEYDTLYKLVGLFLTTETVDELQDLYLEQVLDETGISVQAARRATLDLHNLLHSCPDLDHVSLDSFLHQQDCEWFSAGGYTLHRNQTAYNPGYDEKQVGFSGGIQREMTGDLFVELAGVFDLYWLDSDNFEQDGYRASAGAVVKKEIDNFTLSAMLSGGIFGYEYNRSYTTLNGLQSASSNPFGGFVSGEVRASAIFNSDRFYTKPSLALTAIQIWQQSFTEQGSGGLEWQIDGVSESYFAIRPAIELGGSFTVNDRPATAFIRTGLSAYLNDPDTSLSGRFSGFGDTIPGFDILLDSDRFFGELAVGMNVEVGQGATLSLTGQGSLSENSWAAGGAVRFTHRF